MKFSRQEYWSGLPFPSPGHLPDPGIEPRSPTMQADALPSEPPGKPKEKGLGSCCCSVAQSSLTLCDPIDCSMPGSPVLHYFPELAQTQVHRVRMPSNHLILCRPRLLLPSVFPSMRGFFNESVLPIKWPKYWSFSFSISPSNEHSWLISFQFSSVQFSRSVVSNSLRPHESQHARPPCPSPTLRAHSDSHPSSQ